MRRVALILSTALALSLAAGQAGAEQCRDAQGHYVTCPKPTAKAAEPHAATSTTQQKCRNEKGHFVKCPAGATASTSTAAPAAAASQPTTKSAKASKPAKSASAATTGASANTAATTKPAAPGAVTARCKDGTMSHSQHRSGTCANHGGVAQWM